MNIIDNYRKIKTQIPENVTLVAVSKTKPADDILKIYNEGHRDFGENKVQELVSKYETLPKDIKWHMIGHLQTNKVKYIVPFVHLIHSVDSLKLLKEINKRAAKNNRVVNCLLECHIAKEQTKFGLPEKELFDLLESNEFKEMQNVRICGLMGMATNTSDKKIVKKEFEYLANLFKIVKNKFFEGKDYFKEISMGMSGDYKEALEKGATIVRIGSSIFGARNYTH